MKTSKMVKVMFGLAAAMVFSACSGDATANGNNGNGNDSMGGNGFSLQSNDFSDGGTLPDNLVYESPQLTWSNVPAGTVGFAIIVDDPDASGFIHWNVFIYDKTARTIETDASGRGTLPPNSVETPNDFNDNHYDGPQPSIGETHTYNFCIYAMKQMPDDLKVDSFSNTAFHDQHGGDYSAKACISGKYTGK